jgi:hypothetical protein
VYESRIVEISIYGLTRGAGSHPLLLYRSLVAPTTNAGLVE